MSDSATSPSLPTQPQSEQDRPEDSAEPATTGTGHSGASVDRATLRPSDPMIVFAYACLSKEYEALVEHRPSDGQPPDPEEIHQMRIAARRLRVSLKMFGQMLPGEAAKRFDREFQWFARSLGELRDLDVQAENFKAYQQTIGAEHLQELGGYELHLRRARAEARESLDAVFSAPRYMELMESFGALLHGAPSPGALRRWRSYRVSDGLKKILRKSLRRVRKLGRRVDSDTPAERLHKLRIRAKRLRYELEFFRDVYPSLDKAAKATKHLQDVLGEHQDACTAAARLQTYARSIRRRSGRSYTVPAAFGLLQQREQQKAANMRLAFAAEWQRFQRIMDRTPLA